MEGLGTNKTLANLLNTGAAADFCQALRESTNQLQLAWQRRRRSALVTTGLPVALNR